MKVTIAGDLVGSRLGSVHGVDHQVSVAAGGSTAVKKVVCHGKVELTAMNVFLIVV